ncbi:MAG: hypothetical protein QOJ67_4152 [Acidimicrobiaceae bacterium]
MPQVSSLRERRRDRSATRVAVTITGDVSPAEQVDALAVFEELSRDAGRDLPRARCRIEARVNADRLANVDAVMILEDGHVIFAWSVERTMHGALRKVSRRLHAQIDAAARRPALGQTA